MSELANALVTLAVTFLALRFLLRVAYLKTWIAAVGALLAGVLWPVTLLLLLVLWVQVRWFRG